MELALLVDFGSTYTKLGVVDVEAEELVAWAQAGSTVNSDMTIAYEQAFAEIMAQLGDRKLGFQHKLCCSSAAGGLRIVCSGLVPSLTSKAAMFASWGAGGKIVGHYSYELSDDECSEIEKLRPDVVLLAGGTDGGDRRTCVINAGRLARTSLECPFLVSTNKSASSHVENILRGEKKQVIVTENVLPELDRLNVAPAQETIRKLFMERIIYGKRLDKAKSLVSPNVIPTPLAVFKAAQLLARGTGEEEEGMGELVLVDVGGSTTDVVSVCEGRCREANSIQRGIPEPYAKRTVEGDLGIRGNAVTVLQTAGEEKLRQMASDSGVMLLDMAKVQEKAEFLSTHTSYVPQDEEGQHFDRILASVCVDFAMARHAGKLEECRSPAGDIFFLQFGKDLRSVKKVIGTGGVFVHNLDRGRIFQGAASNDRYPLLSLKPEAPECYVDKSYIFFAMGLLGEIFPVKALRILKRNLQAVHERTGEAIC